MALLIDWFLFLENKYKQEIIVDGEPILFEILDTCPKVINNFIFLKKNSKKKFFLEWNWIAYSGNVTVGRWFITRLFDNRS